MNSKAFVTEKQYENQYRKRCLLKYYLVETSSRREDVFGICIEKYEVDRRNLTLVDEETVTAISSARKDVMRIIDKLARGLVTPFMLVEILDDYLS